MKRAAAITTGKQMSLQLSSIVAVPIILVTNATMNMRLMKARFGQRSNLTTKRSFVEYVSMSCPFMNIYKVGPIVPAAKHRLILDAVPTTIIISNDNKPPPSRLGSTEAFQLCLVRQFHGFTMIFLLSHGKNSSEES